MKKKNKRFRLLQDDEWTVLLEKLHQCCDCDLVHRVRYKLHNGVLFEQWTRHETETAKARRKSKKLASNTRA